MPISLSGKTAIITGAASGCGLAIARRFCELGANVILADADEKQLDIEAEVLEGSEGEVLKFHGNLSEKLDIKNLIAASIDRFETVDILVNAARLFAIDPDDDYEMLPRLLDRNVTANFRLSQHVAKLMATTASEREDHHSVGSIINLTSTTHQGSLPGLLAYSVSMAALTQLTRSMALTYAADGVRVNAIAIGSVKTTSLREYLREDDTIEDIIAAHTPLGYVADAREIADTAVYLASDMSNFMTGQVLTLDGGRMLRDPVPLQEH